MQSGILHRNVHKMSYEVKVYCSCYANSMISPLNIHYMQTTNPPDTQMTRVGCTF